MKLKLDNFEGPLDLLLHLIDINQVNIYDIPITEVTDQYMEFLNEALILNLEVASEFLVMASTLLLIKSKMLLPQKKNLKEIEVEDLGIDPREELVEKLLEYRKFKQVADILREKETNMHQLFTKSISDMSRFNDLDEFDINQSLSGITLITILNAFQQAILKCKQNYKLNKVVNEEISINDKKKFILNLLDNVNSPIKFSSLLANSLNKSEIIITFLALLDLINKKKLICYQQSIFADILIERVNNCG